MDERHFDLVIVDARNLLWRMADAHKALSATINGVEISTGGIYGFLGALSRLRRRYSGIVAVAWESEDGRNFRKDLFPEYKANRSSGTFRGGDAMLSDVPRQEREIKRVLSQLGVRQWHGVNCEGDDVVATLAQRGLDAGRSVAVYSLDGDLHQLVIEPGNGAGSIVCVQPIKGEDAVLGEVGVFERHGVAAYQIPVYKALMGDAGDNIPGVDGIGEKKARELVTSLGSVERIIEEARLCATGIASSWPLQKKYAEAVWGARELVRTCEQLATVKRDAQLSQVARHADPAAVRQQLMQWRMSSLITNEAFGALMELAK